MPGQRCRRSCPGASDWSELMHHLYLPLFSESYLIIIVGFVAGIMNALGGGGTFVTFPFLLYLGIPAVVANATSTVATWPGTLAVLTAYRKELVAHRDKLLLFGVISTIGGGIGALLLVELPNTVFAKAVPYLLLFATILFTCRVHLVRWINDNPGFVSTKTTNPILKLFLEILMFFISIYCGFFGAGSGILILSALSMSGMEDIHKMNALRAHIGLWANTVALGVFAYAGIVYWKETALMATGIICGGYCGASYFRTIPSKIGQWIIAALAWGITGIMFFR